MDIVNSVNAHHWNTVATITGTPIVIKEYMPNGTVVCRPGGNAIYMNAWTRDNLARRIWVRNMVQRQFIELEYRLGLIELERKHGLVKP